MTLCSELALLLVARGESETLTVLLLFTGPDLTLYIEDAGIFVINGRKLPGLLRLISICLKAMSKDFFDRVLPKPVLSGADDFPVTLLWADRWSSCFGGANLRMLITLSTILVPIRTGFTLSLPLECDRLAGTELPLTWMLPLGALPLEGEHDCRLCLPVEPASTEDDRELGAPGLPLEADKGLSGIDVLKFGGASREKPGISEGCQGLDFTVGELPRDGTGFLEAAGVDLVTDDDLPGGTELPGTLDGVEGRLVGVAALDDGLDAGMEDRAVGVEDLAEGVDVLAEGATGFEEGMVALEVGVEGLEGLLIADNVGRPVGVAGRDAAEPGPPDDEGLRTPVLEEFKPGDNVDCLDAAKFPLDVGSI